MICLCWTEVHREVESVRVTAPHVRKHGTGILEVGRLSPTRSFTDSVLVSLTTDITDPSSLFSSQTNCVIWFTQITGLFILTDMFWQQGRRAKTSSKLLKSKVANLGITTHVVLLPLMGNKFGLFYYYYFNQKQDDCQGNF